MTPKPSWNPAAPSSKDTVFVVGMDAFNARFLPELHGAEEVEFRALTSYGEAVMPPREMQFGHLLETCETRLAAFAQAGGRATGVIGWWDFPCCALVPLLSRRHGLPGPDLAAVAACEHKYFARLEQAKAVPEMTPRFAAVDPFAENPKDIPLAYPFWLKPVLAHSSFLGFRVSDEAEFDHALEVIRREIGHLRDPVDTFLEHAGWPDGTHEVSGDHCIAEEIISAGRQCTLEGYVFAGEPEVFGVIDTLRSGRYQQSLTHYRYPSALPARVQERMGDAAKRVMRQIGYDNGAFNMEFYWDEATDSLKLLEVNSRISKSHTPLFRLVDGVGNFQVLFDLTRGRRPRMPQGEGPFAMAQKSMLRVSREKLHDAIVTRVPSEADIARVKEVEPQAEVRILVREGQRLSDLDYQESYSYLLADLFLGANSAAEIDEKARRCEALLPFEFEPIREAA